MRQRREIPIHIFELAYATVSYEPIFKDGFRVKIRQRSLSNLVTSSFVQREAGATAADSNYN